jgi:hypothetical protein
LKVFVTEIKLKSLNDYTKSGLFLHLNIFQDPIMKVGVIHDENRYLIPFKSLDTVKSLKDKIKELLGYPTTTQTLYTVKNGKSTLMRNRETLGFYQINEGIEFLIFSYYLQNESLFCKTI